MGKHIKTRSSLETKLPKEVLEEVHHLLMDNATYDEIEEFCRNKGYDISRSAVGRYGPRFLQLVRETRQTEDQAKSLLSNPGEGMWIAEAISKVAQQQLLSKLISGELDLTDTPEILTQIARIQEAEIKREKLKADLAAKINSAIKEAESKPEMTKDEALNWIRERVYGI